LLILEGWPVDADVSEESQDGAVNAMLVFPTLRAWEVVQARHGNIKYFRQVPFLEFEVG
jgi:hypothetical protein